MGVEDEATLTKYLSKTSVKEVSQSLSSFIATFVISFTAMRNFHSSAAVMATGVKWSENCEKS